LYKYTYEIYVLTAHIVIINKYYGYGYVGKITRSAFKQLHLKLS